MITLPASMFPAQVVPRMVDYGFTVEAAGGGDSLRIDRPGNRYELDVTWPAMWASEARVLVARLVRARSEGLRIPYPLIGAPQGAAGTVVVNGSDSAGTVLKVRGANPGYVFQEGFWITAIDSAGRRRLHNICAPVTVVTGVAILTVDPPLRAFPADGDIVAVAKPEVEGLVTSIPSWSIDADGIVRNLSCTIREAH